MFNEESLELMTIDLLKEQGVVVLLVRSLTNT